MSASRAVPPLGEWPLIGRAIELEAFERALSRPTCAAVVLYGEAGVGKSRLADTFLASADEMGHPIAGAGQCSGGDHAPWCHGTGPAGGC